jgi:hypothetical protein
MKWTEGHKWIKDLVLNEAIFEYKFVVFNQHTNEKLWEDGNNRVCDLNLCDSSPIHLSTPKHSNYLPRVLLEQIHYQIQRILPITRRKKRNHANKR